MTEDEKLAVDEAQRVAQHEAVKAEVRGDLQSKIAESAKTDDRFDATAHAVGKELKQKAAAEVAGSEREIERARVAARISQVVDYIFYVIYGLIGLEILLELLGARDSSGFKRFVDAVSAPLLAPFHRLMPDIGRGPFQLRTEYLIALLVYFLLHLAVNGLLRLAVHRKTAV